MLIKVITFDLDDTLWPTKPPLIAAEAKQDSWLKIYRPKTNEFLTEEKRLDLKKRVWRDHPELKHSVSKMRFKFLFELQKDAGYSHDISLLGAQKAFDIFLNERQMVELFPEVLAIISKLSRKFILGALTNGNADIFLTPVAKYFSFAFRAEEVGASKPAPDLFEAARNFTKVNFNEIIHVGDDLHGDIKGAKEVGAKAIWLNRGPQIFNKKIYPDEEIGSLKELPEAIQKLG